jgi:hypothetical protein
MRTLELRKFFLKKASLLPILAVWSQLLVAGISLASEPVGRAAEAVGRITATRPGGEVREMVHDSPVFSGDIIATGPNSRIRIIMSDNSIIVLRPSTRFTINEYRHTGDPRQDKSFFSLLRGGFRALTGAIGHGNKDSYRIETPSATIGIRGTDHEGRLCAGDCQDLVEIGVPEPPDGLYTGTSEGRTEINGQEFGAGEYGFTDSRGLTVRLPGPPPILLRDPHLREAFPDQKKGAGTTRVSQEENGGFEIPAKPDIMYAVQCPGEILD